MAWYNDFDDFCDAVEDVVEEVGEAIGTGVEAAGDAIDDGLNWLGEQTGEVGGAIFGWLGDVVSGGLHLAGTIIKAAFGIVGGVIGGVIRVIGGIFTLNGDRILTGLGDIFSSIFGGILMILGKFVATIQVVFTLGSERTLTGKEKRELRRVFRESLNYYVIRISEGHAGVFQPGSDRLTLGNTIYFKEDFKLEYLVHECVHVWQYQNGGARYTTDNIWAQMTEDNFNAPDVYVNEINDGKTEWGEFHAEAQAELIEGVWLEGELLDGTVPPPKGNGVFFDADGKSTISRFVHNGTDYTSIANNAVTSVRDGRTPDWGLW